MNTEIVVVNGEGSIFLHEIVQGIDTEHLDKKMNVEMCCLLPDDYLMVSHTRDKPEVRHG